MKVQLIAHTVVTDEAEEILSRPEDALDADYLVEIAGRECYQSQHRPNRATEKNDDYVGHIIRQRHLSVLEHASATFRITGISRALTHELVRHRHLSPSQLSQRFVDAEDSDYIVHPDIRDIEDVDARQRATDILAEVWDHALEAYGELQTILEADGASRKRKNQAARMVLPNMTETKIVLTGNHRAWREVIEKRATEGADSEIHELADLLERELRKIAYANYYYLGATEFSPRS